MRVLLLADGSSVHAGRYQAEMKRQGVEIILASLEEGKTVDVSLPRKTGINAVDYVLARSMINSLVDKYAVDIINPHFASGYGFMTALSGVHERKPVMLHCLGSDILISPKKSWLHRKRVAMALSRANMIMVDSEFLGRRAQEICPGIEYKVVLWGADAAAFEQFTKKMKSGVDWKKPLRIVVPRPHYKVYNNKFILESLKELINEGSIQVTFAAWGDSYNDFTKLAKEICPSGGVRYYDFLARESLAEFLSGFDIYLSASLSDSSPASLVEAMAIGLFPVVGEIPGVREWVDNDKGRLFDLHDKDSLQEAVKNLLKPPANLVEILKNNHTLAKDRGKFADNIMTTIGFMERMVNEREY